MGVSFLKEVERAERTINAIIETISSNGGGVYLSLVDNPDFFVKLDKPVSLNFFMPMNKPEEGT